jgi:hypothetical protein
MPYLEVDSHIGSLAKVFLYLVLFFIKYFFLYKTSGATVIHFCGHGDSSSISFETDRAEVHLVDVANLKALINASEGTSPTKCVFVSACHSENIGRAFIEAGVSYVVAVKYSHRILDTTALMFTETFYSALLQKRSIKAAFNNAVTRVKLERGERSSGAFILLQRDVGGDESPFMRAISGEFIDETKIHAKYFGPPPLRNFLGRMQPLQKVYSWFVEPARNGQRCVVTVTGERGSGKTALALRCADYMRERDLFDFVFFIPVNQSIQNKEISPEDGPLMLFSLLLRYMREYGVRICIQHLYIYIELIN